MANAQNISFIAPPQLRDGFQVLVESTSGIQLLCYASTLESLLLETQQRTPNVILMYISEDENDIRCGHAPANSIGKIKEVWPHTVCIALVDDPDYEDKVRGMGADIVLLKGVAADRLTDALTSLGGQMMEKTLASQR